VQLPQGLARFNRYVTNPLQRLWAGWAPSMGILEHRGRRSGRVFRTPLTVFSTDDGVAILLTYGPDRDWLKNITAAGGGRLQRHGRSVGVRDPRVMTKEQAAPHVTGFGRRVFPRLPFESAVLLRFGSDSADSFVQFNDGV
jgi:deazaflavin-dependent oxidoreductase (nitroreductase family)